MQPLRTNHGPLVPAEQREERFGGSARETSATTRVIPRPTVNLIALPKLFRLKKRI